MQTSTGTGPIGADLAAPARTVPFGVPAPGTEVVRSESELRRFLLGLPGVDQVGVEERAARLGGRSIKAAAKLFAIDAAISMVDLTTLEGADTPGKVRALCGKTWVPDRDPRRYPLCPTCKEIAEHLGWKLPAR